jgi:hypothetical protein
VSRIQLLLTRDAPEVTDTKILYDKVLLFGAIVIKFGETRIVGILTFKELNAIPERAGQFGELTTVVLITITIRCCGEDWKDKVQTLKLFEPEASR